MLTSMDDDVLGQVPDIDEGLTANAALVRPDVVMVANVIGQLAGLDKSAEVNRKQLALKWGQ